MYETALSMTLPGRQRLPLIGRKVPKSYKLMEKLIVEEQQKLEVEKRPLCLTQNQFLDIIESLPAKHNDLQSAEETAAGFCFQNPRKYNFLLNLTLSNNITVNTLTCPKNVASQFCSS